MKQVVALPWYPQDRLVRVDLIGALGWNAGQRVLPALAPYARGLDLVGYDLALGPPEVHGFSLVRVRDNADLAARLHARRPDVVWIETPDDAHREHIRLALDAGAGLVLCEKCIAKDAAEGAAVLSLCEQARSQQVRFIDHYLGLWLVHLLHANTPAWLGRVRQLRVTLLESQGVPPHQERSHANGMTNFFHHVPALAGRWFDPLELWPAEAAWGRHPQARVPDTYRRARFASVRTGTVVVEGAVGKYLAQPRREIEWFGTHGHARLDRDRNELHVTGAGGRSFTLAGRNGDSGYGELARALATGEPLPGLLTPAEALRVLLLVELAHGRAEWQPVYPAKDVPDAFVCDWEMPASIGDRAEQPSAITQ
jgi:predicted dehydrogenase